MVLTFVVTSAPLHKSLCATCITPSSPVYTTQSCHTPVNDIHDLVCPSLVYKQVAELTLHGRDCLEDPFCQWESFLNSQEASAVDTATQLTLPDFGWPKLLINSLSLLPESVKLGPFIDSQHRCTALPKHISSMWSWLLPQGRPVGLHCRPSPAGVQLRDTSYVVSHLRDQLKQVNHLSPSKHQNLQCLTPPATPATKLWDFSCASSLLLHNPRTPAVLPLSYSCTISPGNDGIFPMAHLPHYSTFMPTPQLRVSCLLHPH